MTTWNLSEIRKLAENLYTGVIPKMEIIPPEAYSYLAILELNGSRSYANNCFASRHNVVDDRTKQEAYLDYLTSMIKNSRAPSGTTFKRFYKKFGIAALKALWNRQLRDQVQLHTFFERYENDLKKMAIELSLDYTE